ncbi:MAG: hypothetical protein Unbinned4162contig1001_75 [Prokaryotic dsDNA virus sp.]|nr:MAG: hypothetical protein Unbinned4162contig1001_75 [Prokaryotic dsDNA virus sp.]
MRISDNLKTGFVTVIILTILIFGGAESSEDLEIRHRAYCDNVELYWNSRGEQGHPDFNDIYFTECE